MSDRSEKIVVYVSEQTKNAVKHEAATEDKSMAEWSRGQLHRGLKNKQEDRMLHETNAEERINQLIAQMDDRLAKRLEDWDSLIGATANYAAANHILFQQFEGISSKLADDARSDASAILQDRPTDTSDPQQQPSKPQQLTDGSDTRASESRAQSEQQQQQEQQQQEEESLPGDVGEEDLWDDMP
jgi:hypothetical protein